MLRSASISSIPQSVTSPSGRERADRGVLRHASTWKIEVIMALDSVKNAQVGVDLEHPSQSPLPLGEG
ncbi:hypothetical protein BSZ28_17105 [Pseudomonas moraviensis]|nr:hypothetical protein BSZ28_17105 [Pseudomonas moraviensis]